MKTKRVILLALLAVLASSCKGEEDYRLKLTEVDKQMIPYRLGQTVSFINSSGQVFDATVTEDKTDWWVWDEGLSVDRRTVRLQSEFDNIDIELWVNGCDRYVDSINFVRILVRDFSQFRLYYDSKEGGFLEQTPYEEEYFYFYDSLEINNKVYYDVVEDKAFNGATQIFYNKTYGILQVAKNEEIFLTRNHNNEEDTNLRLAETDDLLSEELTEDSLFYEDERDIEIDISEKEIKNSDSPISVFPNPSKGVVYIRSTNHGAKNVQIYNTSRTMIYKQEKITNQQEVEIDLSRFPNGVYTFVIETNGKRYEHKVILNR